MDLSSYWLAGEHTRGADDAEGDTSALFLVPA